MFSRVRHKFDIVNPTFAIFVSNVVIFVSNADVSATHKNEKSKI